VSPWRSRHRNSRTRVVDSSTRACSKASVQAWASVGSCDSRNRSIQSRAPSWSRGSTNWAASGLMRRRAQRSVSWSRSSKASHRMHPDSRMASSGSRAVADSSSVSTSRREFWPSRRVTRHCQREGVSRPSMSSSIAEVPVSRTTSRRVVHKAAEVGCKRSLTRQSLDDAAKMRSRRSRAGGFDHSMPSGPSTRTGKGSDERTEDSREEDGEPLDGCAGTGLFPARSDSGRGSMSKGVATDPISVLCAALSASGTRDGNPGSRPGRYPELSCVRAGSDRG
jgi:hypothetical protein